MQTKPAKSNTAKSNTAKPAVKPATVKPATVKPAADTSIGAQAIAAAAVKPAPAPVPAKRQAAIAARSAHSAAYAALARAGALEASNPPTEPAAAPARPLADIVPGTVCAPTLRACYAVGLAAIGAGVKLADGAEIPRCYAGPTGSDRVQYGASRRAIIGGLATVSGPSGAETFKLCHGATAAIKAAFAKANAPID